MKNRRELKAEYLQQKPKAGVFQVKNLKNGMLLLDSAINMPSKWNRHRTELRFGSHRNKTLQQDWNEMGEAGFEFSVLSELEILTNLNFDLVTELKILYEIVEDESKIDEKMRY